jgi:hypothetical protein
VRLAWADARALGLRSDITNPDSIPLGQDDAGFGFNSAHTFDSTRMMARHQPIKGVRSRDRRTIKTVTFLPVDSFNKRRRALRGLVRLDPGN